MLMPRPRHSQRVSMPTSRTQFEKCLKRVKNILWIWRYAEPCNHLHHPLHCTPPDSSDYHRKLQYVQVHITKPTTNMVLFASPATKTLWRCIEKTLYGVSRVATIATAALFLPLNTHICMSDAVSL